MEQWVNFYSPDGKCLSGYTVTGTFAGEVQATKDLLAAESGIAQEDIKVRIESKPPITKREDKKDG